MKYDMILKVT